MSEASGFVSQRDLGVSSSCIGAEVGLRENGEVVIEATPFEGGQTTSLVLEREQALALVAWLANQKQIAPTG